MVAFCRYLEHVFVLHPWLWQDICTEVHFAFVFSTVPLHKGKKVRLAPFKVGVEIFMNVGSVSCPNLGFPEAVHMKLPHKTCECGSFEAFQ